MCNKGRDYILSNLKATNKKPKTGVKVKKKNTARSNLDIWGGVGE